MPGRSVSEGDLGCCWPLGMAASALAEGSGLVKLDSDLMWPKGRVEAVLGRVCWAQPATAIKGTVSSLATAMAEPEPKGRGS